MYFITNFFIKVRQKLTLVLFLYSLYGFAQLYVKQGTVFSFGNSDVLFSSQEKYHQIDAPILGEGTLLLNSALTQQLASTQAALELPKLHVKNANLITIQTALFVKKKLTVNHGLLQLFDSLTLPDPSTLVVGETAGIVTTPYAQLHYISQKTINTLPSFVLVVSATTQLSSLEPNPLYFRTLQESIQDSRYGVFSTSTYQTYFQIVIPPPKAV